MWCRRDADGVDRRLLVLVDIDDDVRGRKRLEAGEIDAFRAADLGDAAHDGARMHAESGAADQLGRRDRDRRSAR